MIRPSRLLLIDILLLQAFISVRIVTISFVGKQTDPASSTRSNKKGLNDNNNRLLGIVSKFCIPFGTKIKIVICGGLDSAAL